MKIFDVHNDAITELSPEEFEQYVKDSEEQGVCAMSVSVWTTGMENPMQKIREYRRIIDETKTNVKLLLHIEDAWFLNDDNVGELIALRPISVGLTWNENNGLAGGAFGDGGLTPMGKTVINKLVKEGIFIDLAHLNRKSFWQVAELLEGSKLFCSHTCFDEVNPHPRNLDAAQIRAIVDSGGLIGLTMVQEFLGTTIFEQLDYFNENFGFDNLSLGTDFFGTSDLPEGFKTYEDFSKINQVLGKEKGHKILWENAYEFFRFGSRD